MRVARAVEPLKDMWLGGDTAQTDMGGAETTKAFHRIWSAVLFLFCTAPFDGDGGRLDNQTLFGEGVAIAGCLALHVLGQRHRFQLFDFNEQVISVHVADTTAPRLDPNLEQYLKRAFMLKRANERVFAMLESSEAPTIYNVWRHCGA